MQKNFEFLAYQIVFDIAAVCVFLDFIEQFEKVFFAGQWFPARHWASKFKASLQNFKNTKDVSALVRAIPIFEGIVEEALQQMVLNSKIISCAAGAKVCS